MRLLIVRHADPVYTTDTITPAGELEAEALALRLKADGVNRLFCSPLGRAIATTKYVERALGIAAGIEPWTVEVWESHKLEEPDGGFLGAWDLPGELIRSERPTPTHDNWVQMACLAGQGERIKRAVDDIAEHSDEFIARLGYRREGGRYRCVTPHRDRVAVVCHGGFALCWLSHLLAIPLPLVWAGFWPPTTSVTTVLFDERSTSWAVPRCIGFGDTSHLYHAGLPVRPRGILANFD